MEEKIPTEREKPNLERNVHAWLRKVFLFVWSAPQGTSYEIKDRGEKGQSEAELRNNLGLRTDKISREEALEACQKLFCMFMVPLEPEVQKFIEDPHCPGGKPRGSHSG